MGTIFLLNPPIFQSKKFSYIKGRKIYETLKYIKVAKKGSLSFTIIYVFNEYADEGHYLYPNMVDANGQPVKGIINPWVFPSVLWTDIYAKFSTTILPLSINLTCNINNVNYTVTKNCSWNLITNTIV